MPRSLTIGSLFSGVGGLELGLERAGLGPVIWQAECDPVGLQVLARHWPAAKRYPDVREVNQDAQRPDIICGGFPCQDISLAGSGAGLAGARSGLWWEYARVVRELRPRWVVVENVAALANRGLDAVLGTLATLGYDATWDCIPAAAIGAPHQRDRLFIIARLVDADCQRQQGRRGSVNSEGGREHTGDTGAAVADGDVRRREGERQQDQRRQQRARGDKSYRSDMPEWPPAPGDMHAWRAVPTEAQPAVCRLADGIPAGLDWVRGRSRRAMLHSYGNAVVPAVAEVVGRAIADAEGVTDAP